MRSNYDARPTKSQEKHAVYRLRCGLWMYVSYIFVGKHKTCLYRQAS